MNTCDRNRELAALRVYGESTEAENRMLELHLEGCESCRRLAEELEQGLGVLATRSRESTSELPADWRRSLREAAGPYAARRRPWMRIVNTGLGFAAGVMFMWFLQDSEAAPAVKEVASVERGVELVYPDDGEPPEARSFGRLTYLHRYLRR